MDNWFWITVTGPEGLVVDRFPVMLLGTHYARTSIPESEIRSGNVRLCGSPMANCVLGQRIAECFKDKDGNTR